MNSPMTWGDYLVVELGVPGALMLLIVTIASVAHVCAVIEQKRKLNAFMRGDDV